MQAPTPLSSQEMREIAHELRAPLGGLSAMIELLARTPLDAEQVRFVAALQASAEHVAELCNRVLMGDGKPAASAAPLGPLVERLALSVAARAARRGLSFRLESSPRLAGWRVSAPGPFRQVLENLIDNAVRLSESGTITLHIDAADSARLAVRLSDEGPGLSQAEAERLIREGGRIEGRPGGAGLGLSIAGRLVAERGGRLSGGPGSAGQGAHFSFDWPAECPVQAARADCLIVDDHPASRQVLAALLSALGHAADVAHGVDEALQLQKLAGYRLILTDLCMPDGGGGRLIRHLAGLPDEQRPHIVLISADPLPIESPLATVVTASVRKPLNVQALASALQLCGLAIRRQGEAA